MSTLAVHGRLCQLEQRLAPVQRDFLRYPKEHIRVFISSAVHQTSLPEAISGPVGRAGLAAATCTRMLTRDGVLTEILHVHGGRHRIPKADMDAFVATFPVQMI